MKPLKLIACLVTLQFFGGLNLKAADQQSFRQWTDLNGRTISARLLEIVDRETVKIERQDGVVFTVLIKTFSKADQAYVQARRIKQNNAAGTPSKLVDADNTTWRRLRGAGSQPANYYVDTPLADILDGINRRLIEKKLKTASDEDLQLRTEPSELAEQIKISGQMTDMNTSDFLMRIAYNHDLLMKVDEVGGLVLVAKDGGGGSFFGVPVK